MAPLNNVLKQKKIFGKFVSYYLFLIKYWIDNNEAPLTTWLCIWEYYRNKILSIIFTNKDMLSIILSSTMMSTIIILWEIVILHSIPYVINHEILRVIVGSNICQSEYFEPDCAHNEVIVMVSAEYGE